MGKIKKKKNIQKDGYKPTKAWEKLRPILKGTFLLKGITQCEVGLRGCWRNNALSFAHRHKRIWYFKKENRKLLGDFNQVLLCCVPCHQSIEGKELTEELFLKLRS